MGKAFSSGKNDYLETSRLAPEEGEASVRQDVIAELIDARDAVAQEDEHAEYMSCFDAPDDQSVLRITISNITLLIDHKGNTRMLEL